MEMKRRDFLKYFFVLSAIGVFAKFACVYARDCVRSVWMADKIKKFPGKIKPLGDEIRTEGKWIG
jgi:hypothetical protein